MRKILDTLYGELLPPPVPLATAPDPATLPDGLPPVPLGRPPAAVRDWFDNAAGAYAGRAKAGNTRRAYRAGVRAWCDWCDRYGLPCLPGRAADVAAFLAAGRGSGLSVASAP
jgi:hypothetical protein